MVALLLVVVLLLLLIKKQYTNITPEEVKVAEFNVRDLLVGGFGFGSFVSLQVLYLFSNCDKKRFVVILCLLVYS